MSVELNEYDAVAVNLRDGGVKFIIVMDGARDPILADVASELVKYNNQMVYNHIRYTALNGVKKEMNIDGHWVAIIYAERDYR